MSQEIERKFLVKGEEWRSHSEGLLYRQSYLSTKDGLTVRIRVIGDHGYLTIKGPTQGYSRLEFEYPIPLADAQLMLDSLCDRPLIEKTRYQVPYHGFIWEIDEFTGDNSGLILAEIELHDENQMFELPEWIDREVSHDSRYYNSNLLKFPYSQWGN